MKSTPSHANRVTNTRSHRGLLPLLLVMLLAMFAVSGCVITPIEAQDGDGPASSSATIAIAPVSGEPGSQVFVSGAGWNAAETVYVNLERAPDGDTIQTTVAVATVDADGRFTISFTYPIDPVWGEAGTVHVIASSLATDAQATAEFNVTSTAPATAAPTATWTPTTVPTGGPTAAPTATARPSNRGTVVSSALNVRSGASVVFPIIRTLSRGAEFTVLGQSASGAWLLVRLSDGLEGWLARAYTDYTGTAPIVATPRPPQVTATPTATTPPYAVGWRGEYYANATLSGTPYVVRDDAAIDFDWGYGAPARGLPSDNFSVRWTRNVYLPAATYRFYAAADDGVRVWVNGEILISEWHSATGQTYAANKWLDAGTHSIRVEFYEAKEIAKIRVWWEQTGDYPDWRGEYYPNIDLRGAPAFVRNDRAIDFDWGRNAPAGNFPADRFSVRWTRDAYFDGGTYRFRATMDDGMRVFLDDNVILDAWQDGSARTETRDVYVGQGWHRVRVEYYEGSGFAVAKMNWDRIGDPTPDHFPDWKGEYWDNRSLDGSPRVVRNDRNLDFNWGTGSPDSRIPSDNFSARWTRHVDFSRGTYRFYAIADDGVRLWVGDTRVINEWRDGRGDVTYTGDIYLDGRHRVKVEYYERTGGARIKVWWERIDSPTATPTPTLTPTPIAVGPYVDLVPARGSGGTPVTVTGGGFPANTRVNLYLGGIARSAATIAAEGHTYASAITDRRGGFSMVFTMPSQWPSGGDITPGRLAVLVATDDFSTEAVATFEYTGGTSPATPTAAPDPYAAIAPSSGGAGTRVTLSGGGFPANTVLRVYLAGLARMTAAAEPESVTQVTTDGLGNFSIAFNMPANWPAGGAIPTGKVLVVVATADFGKQTAVEFDYFVEAVNPTIEIVPGTATVGTQVRVSGGGFPANSTVSLYLAPLGTEVGRGGEQIYAATNTDRFGNYNMGFTMPGTWPNGDGIPNGRIAVVVANLDFSVTVGASIQYAVATPPTATPVPTATPLPTATTTPQPTATVTRVPSASIAPGSGGPGTTVTLSGSGFPANTSVSAYLGRFDGGGGYVEDAQRYATAATNSNGDYSLTFTMPSSWPDGSPIATGRILVAAATDDFGTLVTVTFRYTAVSTSSREHAPEPVDVPEEIPPTATALPPTAVPVQEPTATPIPPTATPEPTVIPPTATPLPPTATPEPTPVPPTATPEPPSEEPEPVPTDEPGEEGEPGESGETLPPGNIQPGPPSEDASTQG